MKKKSENLSNKYIITQKDIIHILFIGIFVFNSLVRTIFIKNNISKINIIALICILILLLLNKKFSLLLIFQIILLGIIMIKSQLSVSKNLNSLVLSLTTYIFPLLILMIHVRQNDIQKLELLFLKIFNKIILLITIIGIIDFITKGSIARVFANIYNNESYSYMVDSIINGKSSYRYFSFMGHPLYTTQLYFMFYVINQLYNRYFEEYYKSVYVMILTIIGISLTASKTGFVLLIICILLLQDNTCKVRNWFYIFLLSILSIISGIFDNIIFRFKTTDLMSGRIETMKLVNSLNYYPFKFWKGYGSEFTFYMNKIIPWASAAYEFPILLFSLEYGIFFTILLYIIIFIYPVFYFLKNKSYDVLIGYLIVFVDINTYNGLGLIGDNMLVYCIYLWLLINISKFRNSYNQNLR